MIEQDEDFTISMAREYLLELYLNIKNFNINDNLKASLFGLILDKLILLDKVPNDDNFSLKVFSIIISLKDEPVYYILDKTYFKEFIINNSWFFTVFRKTTIIAENEFYVMVKDEYPSNLAFLSNIIMNKDKKVILQRPNQGEWAAAFLNSIKD